MGKRQESVSIYTIKRIALKAVMIIIMILILILAVSFPFILDFLYGKGKLKAIYPNSFSAEVWFSFIGSYFPAAIIGIITLYQAYIIQRQDKQYKSLLARHRFIPEEHAHVYRTNLREKKLGRYTESEIEKLLTQNDRSDLFMMWEEGYVIECSIYDSSGVGIEQSTLESICWEINGEEYIQNDSGQMVGIIGTTGRNQYRVTVFCMFNESTGAEEEIMNILVR